MASSLPAFTNPSYFREWEIDHTRFQNFCAPERQASPDSSLLLGKGSYGSVGLFYDHQLKIYVAIKRMRVFQSEYTPELRLTVATRYYREIALLTQIKHKTLVNLLHICPPQNLYLFTHVCLVFEYINSDLFKVFYVRWMCGGVK
jgi:serine/threonine protein kinase